MTEHAEQDSSGERRIKKIVEQVESWVTDLITSDSGPTEDVIGLGAHDVDPETVLFAQVLDLSRGGLAEVFDVEPLTGVLFCLTVFGSRQEYVDGEVESRESLEVSSDGSFSYSVGAEEIYALSPAEVEALVTSFRLRYHVAEICNQNMTNKFVVR